MTDEAETFLRLIAEAELRGAIEPGSAESGLRRLEIIADTLTKVGQLEPEVAESVVACQELALAARGKIDGDPHRYRTVGRPARIRLLTLVLAPDRTVLTLTATRPDPRPDDAFEILWPATASDSRGARYRTRFAEFGGAISHLELEPPVRPGPHWLEVTFQPGTTPYRISLTASAAPPVQFTSEPSERRVERYLDSVTEQLLRPGSQDRDLRDLIEPDYVLTVLRGVHAIRKADPALRRLVTLARRQRIRLPADLAKVADTDLLPSWTSVLDHAGARDGPDGLVPIAAVLPELDGTRWVIASLSSGPASARLLVLCWGGSRRSGRYGLGSELGEFTWSASDSAGRWHLVTSSRSSGNHTDLELGLTPPIDPNADNLDLMLSGRSGTITASVPLSWVP